MTIGSSMCNMCKTQTTVLNSLGCRMNVEDDLRSWRCPLQVAPHSDPQLVDVRMLAVIRRDGQRVWDGQQLKQDHQRADESSGWVLSDVVVLLYFIGWKDSRGKCMILAGTNCITFCGASCSGTSQSSSEAAGSCMPSNCLSKPMATDSAELDWKKDGELETKQKMRNTLKFPCKNNREDTINFEVKPKKTILES